MRIAVSYHGRVQGVGFRATVRSLAADLPVTGWVRNEADGSVRMEAQGGESDLRTLEARVEGAMGRFIRTSERRDIDSVAGETGFVIRR